MGLPKGYSKKLILDVIVLSSATLSGLKGFSRVDCEGGPLGMFLEQTRRRIVEIKTRSGCVPDSAGLIGVAPACEGRRSRGRRGDKTLAPRSVASAMTDWLAYNFWGGTFLPCRSTLKVIQIGFLKNLRIIIFNANRAQLLTRNIKIKSKQLCKLFVEEIS